MKRPATDTVAATPPSPFASLKYLWSRDRKLRGKLTGGTRDCQLAGCRGIRLGVRWPDGTLTWPCSKGIIGNKIG